MNRRKGKKERIERMKREIERTRKSVRKKANKKGNKKQEDYRKISSVYQRHTAAFFTVTAWRSVSCSVVCRKPARDGRVRMLPYLDSQQLHHHTCACPGAE